MMKVDVRVGGAVLLLAMTVAAPAAAQVEFVNHCSKPLNLMVNGTIVTKLAARGGSHSMPISGFRQGGPNLVIPYPVLTTAECPNCDDWTALGGSPGTVQRQGFMWEGANVKFAAYCNPALSGRGICAAQGTCCGPRMTQDGTFGTHWEFTPNASGGNDFVNLSTNFGFGPHRPPPLCGSPGAKPDNCVTKAANIFFNVPVKWSVNATCSFTSKKTKVHGLECLEVSCPDAYRHPTDDKQAACPTADPDRVYTVEYCPAGSSLP